MLTCKQVSEFVSQSLDRKLTRRERWALRFHLLICVACARFNRQLASMQKAIDRWLADSEQNAHVQLSAQARVRMSRRLESETSGSGSRSSQ